jgi:ribosomal protein L37AE/L43A
MSIKASILKLLFTQIKKMLANLTKPLHALSHRTTAHSRQDTGTTLGQSMMIKHNCPCCSDTLLRHMRLGGLYWRCSSCNQEMPVLETSAGTELDKPYPLTETSWVFSFTTFLAKPKVFNV